MGNKMCNDCWLSMQNCHDKSICCEMDEYDGDQCDWFEPMHIVHGHWIKIGSQDSIRNMKCSICGEEVFGDVDTEKYCFNCGAKMDEVTECD